MSLNSTHYQVHYYLTDRLPEEGFIILDKNKPEYRVPLMSEIKSIPWNGYNAISTFSGCGGSCLGYRMAGFRVLWASEFIPTAQQVYKLNHPDSILDTRDIRKVQPQEILEATGLAVGELDLLDGSPPCASFSTAGTRTKSWGEVKAYSDTKQRVDDLFFEYTRLIEGLQPKVFVAENVRGLVTGKAKGVFKEILAEMKSKGYRVKAKLLDAKWLGVPQSRSRLIFVGVRNDLNLEPVHPKPLPYLYTLREALPWVAQYMAGGFKNNWQTSDRPYGTVVQRGANTGETAYLSANGFIKVDPQASMEPYATGAEWEKLKIDGKSKKYFNLIRSHPDKPVLTVTALASIAAGVAHPYEKRKFYIDELKRICAFPDDFELTGTYSQQWERLGRAVPPVMMAHIAQAIKDEVLDKLSN